MPTSLDNVVKQTATTIAQAAPAAAGGLLGKAPKSPLWQWAFAIGLMLVPFLTVGGVILFLANWYKKKSMTQIAEIFLKNGDIDDKEFPRDASSFRYRGGAYEMLPGRPHLSRRHWLFGFRRPVHLFTEGVSLEQDMKTTKKLKVKRTSREITISAVIYPGDDLANAKYLESRFDEERSHKLFAPGEINAFLVVIAIAAVLLGSILGYMIAVQTLKCPAIVQAAAAAVKK
jgi:hypothetical protein